MKVAVSLATKIKLVPCCIAKWLSSQKMELEFKSWTKRHAFYFMVMPLENALINLISPQL